MSSASRPSEDEGITPDAEDIIKFLQSDEYKEEVSELGTKYPREKRSLYVDASDLAKHPSTRHFVGAGEDGDDENVLHENPDYLIERFEEALHEGEYTPQGMSFPRAKVRFYNTNDATKATVRELRDEHCGSLWKLNVKVQEATDVRPKYLEAAFECQRCGTMTYIPQSGSKFQEPHECQGCERQGPFQINDSQSEFIDSQHLKVQEKHEEIPGGKQPQDIPVHVKDELAGAATAGDDITVYGIVRRKPPEKNDDSLRRPLYIEGNNIVRNEQAFEDIEVTDEDIERIEEVAYGDNTFDDLIDSIAPSIHGYDTVKKAMGLQLFSGVTKFLPDGSRIRGDFHMLLIGDPGTGKSAMIAYIKNIAPRAVYTSGKSSSSAGLTASAVRSDLGDGDNWTLKGGAMVMADKGIAAVDELDKMSESDRSAMHEGLEQQEISVSKAGINATLKSRCSMLAAANPKYGRWDEFEPIGEQIDIDPALISRFDLIFTVTDEPNEEDDEELAQHILESNLAGQMATHVNEMQEPSFDSGDVDDAVSEVSPKISPDLFKKYVAHSKKIKPVMTEDAIEHIRDFYVDLRNEERDDDDNAVPVTARKLEGLVRLAEASARIRLSETVEVEDAERATTIVRRSLEDVGIDPETGEFDADIVETGQSSTQRERKIKLVEIVSEVAEEATGADVDLSEIEGVEDGDNVRGAPIPEILKRAESMGYEQSKAEEELEKLRRKGEVYEPASDQYQTT